MIKNKFGVDQHGLAPSRDVHWNLSVPQLVELAVTRREGLLTRMGALSALTGKRTGRSPGDKFIVKDKLTEKAVDWGKTNAPMEPEVFGRLHKKVIDHLNGQELFVVDARAGADAEFGMPIRVVTTKAWHALFAHQLFRRPTREEMAGSKPEFVILAAPDCLAEPGRDGTASEAFIVIDFTRRVVLIGGTHYAGEIKKSIFTIMNFFLPERGIFPMHCSANVGRSNDVALFFGLSGTGKTTLSADEARRLIGDDEHGWSDRGVFNFEGGCYAKCIRLSEEREPQIYAALKFGSVLENVVVDPETREEDFDSAKFTENTRAAYPVEYIDHALLAGAVEQHPRAVIFLTCDAFGVLPPISRLTNAQAMYHFLSGYTAKLAGTEAGLGSEPQATFSTGFGQPFLPRTPMTYARLLSEKIARHGSTCFFINTGWNGGPFGVGKRIDLAATRAMVTAALSGKLNSVETKRDPVFGLPIPVAVPGVDSSLLDPAETWKDAAAYRVKAQHLSDLFIKNFAKFPDAPQEVKSAGPLEHQPA
jgi:phosphoenolpyruvate carboxykinase (ATP)